VRESRCQFIPDPLPEATAPFGVVIAACTLLQPADDLGRVQERKTSARGTGLICPVRLEELDEEILAVKSPDFRDLELSVDLHPIEAAPADLDFDGQVGGRVDGQVEVLPPAAE